MSTREDICRIFADHRKREDQVNALVEYCEPPAIWEAYPAGSRHIPVEWIEVGGLRIGIDANGHAAVVEFPEGASYA